MKYKLIKEYPGSPKKGFISNNEGGVSHYHKDHPDFWEEVVEKDYEILSIISTKYNSIYGRGEIQNIHRKNYTHSNNLADDSPWNIHSVKRLHDGEVFNVGDSINVMHHPHHPKGVKIRSLTVDKDYICVSTTDDIDSAFSGGAGFNFLIAEHNIKPLFTTEDGVDIFKNDTYYVVWKDFTFALTNQEPGSEAVKRVLTRYSTQEKAEEYILMNKPCLSIKEVQEAYYLSAREHTHIDKLITIAKSKL